LDTGNFISGNVYLDASGIGLEDLLQALLDAFFDSEASCKPTTTEIRHALQNIRALIFLDNLEIGRDEVISLLDAAPASLFILSSTERSLWGEGEIIPLQGLPENEALKLFERELARPLSDDEKNSVKTICALMKGQPLHILQMASLVRESGRPVKKLLSDMLNEPVDNQSIANISMVYLGESEKQILALLAAAGGNSVALEHINQIIKGDDIQKKTGGTDASWPRSSAQSAFQPHRRPDNLHLCHVGPFCLAGCLTKLCHQLVESAASPGIGGRVRRSPDAHAQKCGGEKKVARGDPIGSCAGKVHDLL